MKLMASGVTFSAAKVRSPSFSRSSSSTTTIIRPARISATALSTSQNGESGFMAQLRKSRFSLVRSRCPRTLAAETRNVLSLKPFVPLQFPSAFDGLQHGDLVRVLNVAAHGYARGDARHLNARAPDLLGDIDRCCFAFHGGIGGQDHLIDLPGIDTAEQVR